MFNDFFIGLLFILFVLLVLFVSLLTLPITLPILLFTAICAIGEELTK
jgi:hypothetical protein